jgi:hypothetical protein
MRAKLAALIALTLLPGCTWTALRQETVDLAGAGSDLRYREVIENLAMTSANPWTLPAYSSIYAGAMDVSDSVGVGGTSTWVHSLPNPSGFSSQTLDVPASRNVKGNLTLDPTIAPEKLRALRAVFRWAVLDGDAGPDQDLLKTYQATMPPGNYFGVEEELANICQYRWLGKGCRRLDVPRNACYWAHCGNAYVWVCPEGMDCFSRFVLLCQKIARFDLGTLYKPFPGTRQVKWSANDINSTRVQAVSAYVDNYGNLAIGPSLVALPPKLRNDNIGTASDLKASINAAITSP